MTQLSQIRGNFDVLNLRHLSFVTKSRRVCLEGECNLYAVELIETN